MEPHNHDGPGPRRFVRANHFEFIRAAAVAPELDAAVLRTLLLIATTGDGVSGANVTIDSPRIAAARGIAERTVWRHVKRLQGTWLEQTTAPTRGTVGGRGRRARFHLCVPVSSDIATVPGVTRQAPESNDITPREVADETANRLTSEAESSDTAERESAARPASDGLATSPPYPPSDLDLNPVTALWEEESPWPEPDVCADVAPAPVDETPDTPPAAGLPHLAELRRQVADARARRQAAEAKRGGAA